MAQVDACQLPSDPAIVGLRSDSLKGKLMSSNRSRLSAKGGTSVLNFAGAGNSRMEAEQLLNEIDNLALLLHEVKKQTDRIEAAADAIGDSILSHLNNKRAPMENLSAAKAQASRSNPRLRTMPSRAMQLSDV